MSRARILTGGIIALILLAVVCIPRHLSLPPRAAAVTPATFHASIEQSKLVLRGSLPNERRKAIILDQAHALYTKSGMRVIDQLVVDRDAITAPWVDTVPQLLPILGLMVERGSIIIDGRSLVVTGQVAGHREKADVLQVIAPAVRAGLTVEDRVMVAPTTSSSSSIAVSLPALQLSLNQVLAKSSIEFEPNSATITTKGQVALNQIITLLRQAPNAPIEITSHTTTVGNTEHNLQLNRHRAETVKQYLTSHGLTNPFTTIGTGSPQPFSQGKSQPSFEEYQRIELVM